MKYAINNCVDMRNSIVAYELKKSLSINTILIYLIKLSRDQLFFVRGH